MDRHSFRCSQTLNFGDTHDLVKLLKLKRSLHGKMDCHVGGGECTSSRDLCLCVGVCDVCTQVWSVEGGGRQFHSRLQEPRACSSTESKLISKTFFMQSEEGSYESVQVHPPPPSRKGRL